MTPSPIRVLLVDDSRVCREVTRRALEEDVELVVVGEAEDGARAVAATAKLRPDVILMDITMPGMNGLDAVTQIMSSVPTPVLVLSGDPRAGTAELAYEALRRGAIDLVSKEAVGRSAEGRAQLRDRVRFLATVPVVRHLRPRAERPPPPLPASRHGASVIALVASTGGPAALARILEALPPSFPAPLLIVQHLRPGFVEGLAGWLDGVSPLDVRVARDGEATRPGLALLAPDRAQMKVGRGSTVALEPATSGSPWLYCPSGDVLLDSAARELGAAAAGVVLTGMGRDGAAGLQRLRRTGGATLVQDQTSSAVYGMPLAALELDPAHQALPLAEIAPALVRLTAEARRA